MASLKETVVLLICVFPICYMMGEREDVPWCNCIEDRGILNFDRLFQLRKVSDGQIACAYLWIALIVCRFTGVRWSFPMFILFAYLYATMNILDGLMFAEHSFSLTLFFTIIKVATSISACYVAYKVKKIFRSFLTMMLSIWYLDHKVRRLKLEISGAEKKTKRDMCVRRFVQTVNKTLDTRTIINTTIIELSTILDLQNCAFWFLNDNGQEISLAYDLRAKPRISLPLDDPDVQNLKTTKGVRVLGENSSIGKACKIEESDTVVAAPIQLPGFYAILVLVRRSWDNNELNTVQHVVQQISGALSSAIILCQTAMAREKLVEGKQTLNLFRKEKMMAEHATKSIKKVIGMEIRKPMHTVSSLLSVIQGSTRTDQQKNIVEGLMTAWLQFRQAASILVDYEEQLQCFKPFFNSLQVLLVDEDLYNSDTTRAKLMMLGCKVRCVSSGFECLGAAGNVDNSFHVIFLEINLSDINGLNVAKILREYNGSYPLIVALTSIQDADIEDKCKQVGINAIFRKPLRLHGLPNLLRRLLQETDSSGEEEVGTAASSGYSILN